MTPHPGDYRLLGLLANQKNDVNPTSSALLLLFSIICIPPFQSNLAASFIEMCGKVVGLLVLEFERAPRHTGELFRKERFL
ncbi:hypothetical protein JTE90_000076 [Oedothorax gibbosus]|uniref:Uncharacterized protein n=1 Tax=Oedothorax gibbosus TaxID=931172 RepID=A0AAV6TK05_9ARAC|nr:hypothetical protein JTE90_000076 [Oedothorax gibbosus]